MGKEKEIEELLRYCMTYYVEMKHLIDFFFSVTGVSFASYFIEKHNFSITIMKHNRIDEK